MSSSGIDSVVPAEVGELNREDAFLKLVFSNHFGGPVNILRAGSKEWKEVPLTHGYTEQSRSIGVADTAKAMKTGRPQRANGEMAYHVLDVMQAFHDASDQGRQVELQSICTRPAPLPLGLGDGELD